MKKISHPDTFRSRLARIAAFGPILAAAGAGGPAAPSTAEKAGPLVSLSVATGRGSRGPSSSSMGRRAAPGILSSASLPTLAVAGLICLLGLTISVAVVLDLPEETLSWFLSHME